MALRTQPAAGSAGGTPAAQPSAALEEPAQPPRSTARLITVFIGLILGILMAAMDQTIVATAMPTIAGELNGLDSISWIITAYLLAQTIAMPVYGKLGDFIGRKRAFFLAIGIFLAGSVLAGIAPSMGALIAFRAVQGVGAGGLLIGAQTIMAEIVSARERGKYMSVMGPMIGLATVFGPLLGGYLTEHATWRWIFYINVPLGIAAAAVTAIALRMPDTRRRARVDYLGTVLMASAIACLMLVLTWGGRQYAWTSPTIVLLALGFLVLAPSWLYAESRAAEPILPLRLFRDEVFRINVALAFLVGGAMFGAVSYLPTYLQLSTGTGITESGLLMLPLMGGLMSAAVVTGQVVSRTGRYKIFPVLGTATAAVGAFLLSLLEADTSQTTTSLSMVVLGVGIGFIMPVLVLTVQNSLPVRDMGSGTAGVNFFRQLGASFGTALIGSLFVGRLTDQLARRLPDSAASQVGEHASGIRPEQLSGLPPSVFHDVVVSYAQALMPLYAYVTPLLLVGFVLALFLKEKPLAASLSRGKQQQQEVPEEAPDASS